MKESEVQLSVRLPESLIAELREEAHARSQKAGVTVSMASVIREVVRAAIQAKRTGRAP